LILFWAGITGMALYASCRKIDTQINKNAEYADTRFFNSHRTSDKIEAALVNFIRKEDSKKYFVEKTIKQIGYPRWDKTLAKPKSSHGRGASDSISTYYIPFVRDSQNYVNALMAIRTSQADTSFTYICDWQYSQSTFSSSAVDTSAEGFALFFMMMDKIVFGHTDFVLTDTLLFSDRLIDSDTTLRVVHLLNTSGTAGRSNILIYEECLQFAVCGSPNSALCTGANGCDYLNCASEPDVCGILEICWEHEIGGGGSGGGGSGNPPGGGGPPPCGNGNPQRSALVSPCGPGWVPIPEPGGGGSPDDPCDKVAALKTDSLFKESVNELKSRLAENKEYAYLHKSSGGRIGILPGEANACELKASIYTTTPMLKSHIHSHNNACPLPIFSPDDLMALGDLFTMNNYLFPQHSLLDPLFSFGLVTDSAFYLMVIDDPNAFEDFCNDYFFPESPYDMKRLTDVYNSYDIDRSNSSAKNEEEFLRFLKRLGIKVKLLKANNDLSAYSIIMLNRTNNRVSPIPCPQ
jgi:hypothetical protein